ncbi:MAG: hypothetical protein Q8L06_03090 [Pseudohongiella sp.]|nr:hypothetical protein [Pseudohongiella sp.]
MADHTWLCDVYLTDEVLSDFINAMVEGDIPGAIELLQRAEVGMREADDLDPGVYADLAYIYRLSGNSAKALVFYEKAIQEFRGQGYFSGSPGFAGLLVEYANELEKLGMILQTVESLKQALEIYQRHFFDQNDPLDFAALKARIKTLEAS